MDDFLDRVGLILISKESLGSPVLARKISKAFSLIGFLPICVDQEPPSYVYRYFGFCDAFDPAAGEIFEYSLIIWDRPSLNARVEKISSRDFQSPLFLDP